MDRIDNIDAFMDNLVQFEDEERTCSNCRYYRPLNWFEGYCTDPLRGYTKGHHSTYSFVVIGKAQCGCDGKHFVKKGLIFYDH